MAVEADILINVQGDEPLVEPAALDLLAELMQQHSDTEMATLATPLRSLEQYHSPHCVKVVCDAAGRALYFSRSPVPHVRDGQPDLTLRPARFLQHLGLYAYRRSFLLGLARLPVSPLEELEKLEQLRVLSGGHSIRVGIVEHAGFGVDTYEDYQHFVRLHRQSRHCHAA